MLWQPIKTAPKDGLHVVGPAGDYDWTVAEWDHSQRVGWGWFEDGLWMEPQPTHWLAVPACPSPTPEHW